MMFRKRKLENDRKQFQEDLKAFIQTPLTQDNIASQLIHKLCVTVVSLESCIEDAKNLHYSGLDFIDLLELAMNISAINDDIQNYVIKPLERGCR